MVVNLAEALRWYREHCLKCMKMVGDHIEKS
jgi:hypothetical protein